MMPAVITKYHAVVWTIMRDETKILLADIQRLIDGADMIIDVVEGTANDAKVTKWLANPLKLQSEDMSEAEKTRALEYVTPEQVRAILRGNEVIVRSVAGVLTSPKDVINRRDILENLNTARDALQNAADGIRANQ